MTQLYEQYFQYKKDKQYSFHEYVVFHLYKKNIKAPCKTQKKNDFFNSYSNLIAKYLHIDYKLSQDEKNTVKVYFDLLSQSNTNDDYKKDHALSYLLAQKIREFEWDDMDFTSEFKEKNTLHHLSQLKDHSNKVISTISKNIYSLNLDKNDPIYSGIFDIDHIISNHPTIDNYVPQVDLDEFSKVEVSKEITLPIDDNRILKWINKTKSKESSLKGSIKSLINDLNFVWNNDHYQKRSPLINESTFTHDVLSSILKFVAPKIFKRWDQAQSLSAKERGVLKYVDVIGSTNNEEKVFENFFVEVSYGPFHENPEQHTLDDNIKLGKLGKDSLDRNGKYFEDDRVFLFHLHADYLCVSLMDYKYSPIARKVSLDKIQIPFFKNDPGFKILDFIKKLYKYRVIFEGIQGKYEGNSVSRIRTRKDGISTQNTPKKRKYN